MAFIKKHRLQDLELIRGETRLVDCLDHQNSLHLQPEHFQQLKILLRPNSRTDGELQEILTESTLMEYFHPEIYLSSSNGESTHQAQLMRDMLLWGLENPNNALKLDDLSAIIFASRSSLVQNCRSTFGMGPMSLMKNIWPGQVQLALNHPEIRKSIGCTSVRSNSAHYGFQSRNHFAGTIACFSEKHRVRNFNALKPQGFQPNRCR